MREPQIGRAESRAAGARPAGKALSAERPGDCDRDGPGRLTGRAGLPSEVGVQARYKRLAVTHATTISQLPTLSIKPIDFMGIWLTVVAWVTASRL